MKQIYVLFVIIREGVCVSNQTIFFWLFYGSIDIVFM